MTSCSSSGEGAGASGSPGTWIRGARRRLGALGGASPAELSGPAGSLSGAGSPSTTAAAATVAVPCPPVVGLCVELVAGAVRRRRRSPRRSPPCGLPAPAAAARAAAGALLHRCRAVGCGSASSSSSPASSAASSSPSSGSASTRRFRPRDPVLPRGRGRDRRPRPTRQRRSTSSVGRAAALRRAGARVGFSASLSNVIGPSPAAPVGDERCERLTLEHPSDRDGCLLADELCSVGDEDVEPVDLPAAAVAS